MAQSTQYRGERPVLATLRERPGVAAMVGFIAFCTVAAIVTNLVGFPTIAGMIVAFAILTVIVSVLFVFIPVSALALLD